MIPPKGENLQGWAKLPFPGCENAAGKLRQKGKATAGTKFTNPANETLAHPCMSY